MSEIISSEKVITRKPHKCWGCAVEYPKKSKMERTTSKDGGEIMSVYWCESCLSYMGTLPSYIVIEGWDFGGLAEYRKDYPDGFKE